MDLDPHGSGTFALIRNKSFRIQKTGCFTSDPATVQIIRIRNIAENRVKIYRVYIKQDYKVSKQNSVPIYLPNVRYRYPVTYRYQFLDTRTTKLFYFTYSLHICTGQNDCIRSGQLSFKSVLAYCCSELGFLGWSRNFLIFKAYDESFVADNLG